MAMYTVKSRDTLYGIAGSSAPRDARSNSSTLASGHATFVSAR